MVIYRAFVEPDDYPSLELELKSLQAVLDVAAKATGGAEYAPEMTYIAVAKKDDDMRIFSLRPDAANIANPESGTVVDDPKICSGTFPSFYAINQSTTKGTAVPAHFSVLQKPESMTLDFIQSLTYRLSLLYYNSNAAIRLPAPLMYAHRLAKFAGTDTAWNAGNAAFAVPSPAEKALPWFPGIGKLRRQRRLQRNQVNQVKQRTPEASPHLYGTAEILSLERRERAVAAS
eukprot:s624_g31.t1